MSTNLAASVIIPTWNRSAFLRTCLEALAGQTFDPARFEVIVVDDGSVDDTEVVAKEFESKLKNLHFAPGAHAGLNATRNRGINHARADLICFLDDDSVPRPDWLSAVVDASSRHPDALAFGGRILLEIESNSTLALCGEERLGETELDLGEYEHIVPEVFGANMAIRRAAFLSHGYFNEALRIYGDETEWMKRLNDGECVYIPAAIVCHRRTASQMKARALIASRFARGRNLALNARDDQNAQSARLIFAIRYLAHAARRRCMWGVLAASQEIGGVSARLGRRR